MSLINDALKRARENQQRAQPPAGTPPPLEPALPLPARTGGSGAKFALYLLIFCVVVGNLLLFVYASRRQAPKPADLAAAARAMAESAAIPAPPEPPPVPAVAATAPATAPAASAGEVLEEAPLQPQPPVVEPAPPALVAPPPPPLRLQSVILSGARSSAMISGKVLFLGDRIQGWRVTAIAEGRVTLVGDGRTNVLSLPE